MHTDHPNVKREWVTRRQEGAQTKTIFNVATDVILDPFTAGFDREKCDSIIAASLTAFKDLCDAHPGSYDSIEIHGA